MPDFNEMKKEPDSNSQNQKESKQPKTTQILFAGFSGGVLGCVSLAFLAYMGGAWESFPFVGLFFGTPIGVVLGLVVLGISSKGQAK